MSGWRFYPLEAQVHTGILVDLKAGKPFVARFLTPGQAKAIAQDKGKAA